MAELRSAVHKRTLLVTAAVAAAQRKTLPAVDAAVVAAEDKALFETAVARSQVVARRRDRHTAVVDKPQLKLTSEALTPWTPNNWFAKAVEKERIVSSVVVDRSCEAAAVAKYVSNLPPLSTRIGSPWIATEVGEALLREVLQGFGYLVFGAQWAAAAAQWRLIAVVLVWRLVTTALGCLGWVLHLLGETLLFQLALIALD